MDQEDMSVLHYPVLSSFDIKNELLAAGDNLNEVSEGSSTSSDVSEDRDENKGRRHCYPPRHKYREKHRRHVKSPPAPTRPKSRPSFISMRFRRAGEALSRKQQGEIPDEPAQLQNPTSSSTLSSMLELGSSSRSLEVPFPCPPPSANLDPSTVMDTFLPTGFFPPKYALELAQSKTEGVGSPSPGSLIPENIQGKLSEKCPPEFFTDSHVSEGVTMKAAPGRTLEGHNFKVQKRMKEVSADEILTIRQHHQSFTFDDVPTQMPLYPGCTDPGTSAEREYLECLDDFGYKKFLDYTGPSVSSSLNRYELMSMRSESASGGESDAQMEMDTSLTDLFQINSFTDTEPTFTLLQTASIPGWRRQCCLSPSPNGGTSAGTLRRSQSLPNMWLKSSFEDFTPDWLEDDESYSFLCSSSGRYQCSVTGLVFHMVGEGDLVYRIIPWNRRMLVQHQKRPAGPLFHVKCVPPSAACQLYLPHCEIRSHGGCPLLSVAHVDDEGIEFLSPHQITETHVLINISGFSAFGNVKEDSAAEPVQALVLPFYQPPVIPDVTSLLDVLLLPRNVVLNDVVRTRKKLFGDEVYIKTPPQCRMMPMQIYTLSSSPEDDLILVQPTEAEFDCSNYDNYFSSFQVTLEKLQKHLKLSLRDANDQSVWNRRVCLSVGQRLCVSKALNLPPNEWLTDIRKSFIDGVSVPVLQSLLDKLFEEKVIGDSERESAVESRNQRDRARFVIDTVRKKGDAASSVMMDFLCKVDPFLSEHLGLI